MRFVSIICLLILVSCATSKPKEYYDVKLLTHHKARCEYAAYVREPGGIAAKTAVCFQTLRDNHPERCSMRVIDIQDEAYWNDVTRNYWIEGDCNKDRIMQIAKRDRIRDLLADMVERHEGKFFTLQDTHLVAPKFEELVNPRN